ncbi:cupredoxin domain-containing protein [Corynebacterium sp. zg-331]|uniref:cupredoxin domain-containing protein n=1 Tax=unclassified Corynebacterium TaxID=2624378 RepID=UPI00128E003B|nr:MULTISPECIES: cupredoxin domain-containing protein [unclassified Corynebacterium]MBC3186817.1 cupredoxin domain-containing protein [Corynebacterium sp. zg-331]MPV53297.1 copper oxidase [Corynebacterium sp. zg331]
MTVAQNSPDTGRRSWHRRASKPITVWLLIIVLVGLGHPAVPEYRWVLIHAFTLGAVTNSIVVWSQFFTERFLHQRLPEEARPWQLRKIWLLNAGIVVVLAGQIASVLPLTHAGAAVVALALLWHACSLTTQIRRVQRHQAEAARRLLPSVLGYVASALSLTAGAILGALLASPTSDSVHDVALHARLLQAHLILNVLGFLGLAAAASLVVLFPAIWRTRPPRSRAWVDLLIEVCGLLLAVTGALAGSSWLTGGGLLVYALGWGLSCARWASVITRAGLDKTTYGSLSVTASVLWLLACLLWLAMQVLRHGTQAALPTTALLVGFGGQLLIGVMSYLLPTTMRVRAAWGLRETYRGGMLRFTLTNGGLALWLAADNSWLRVGASALALLGLVAFLPLMGRAVRAQLNRGLENHESRPEIPHARGTSGQVALGVALLALLTALCSGLGRPGAAPPASDTEERNVTRVEVTAGDMVFEPASVTVPSGHRLLIELRNEDSQAHDLKLSNGARSGRLTPGKSVEIDAGIITADVPGWCTIAGHHTKGMTFDVLVDPASP